MSQVHSKNTKPEMLVRSALHKLGYRYRLYGKISKSIYSKGVLPGKPDIVLSSRRIVIFIHGCFWHCHRGCHKFSIPKSNTEYWENKLKRNEDRDLNQQKQLKELGWKIIVIWECEINNNENFIKFLKDKLKSQ